MSKPTAIIIGDMHFTIPTLALATEAFLRAAKSAKANNIPLVLNGDTLDSKAIIRAEVANRLIELFSRSDNPKIIVNTGNHDLISEKSWESSLNFLRPYCDVVSEPTFYDDICGWVIPYHNSSDALLDTLDHIPDGARIIIHQGVQTAYLGHYVQDKTSLPPEAFANFRTIASHYHRAQAIKCGPPRKGAVGLFSYIGNPYTLSFGESSDGRKGYHVLYEDGLLTQIPLDLRKHVIIDCRLSELPTPQLGPNDLVWVKLRGSKAELDTVNKVELGQSLLGHSNYKLDKIYDDVAAIPIQSKSFTAEELFDSLIEATKDDTEYLKQLWRDLLNETVKN